VPIVLGIGTVLTPDVVARCRAHRHPDAGSGRVTAKVASMRTTIIHRKGDAPSITVLGSIEEVEARLAAVREDELVEFDTVPPGKAFVPPPPEKAFVAPFAVDRLEDPEAADEPDPTA
jgi:hypothetical protein